MRLEVAIALIVCGTLLALAPPASDYLQNQQLAQILADRKDFNSVSLGIYPMSSQYRFGCWALGAVMIGVGIFGSRCSRLPSGEFDDHTYRPERS